MIRFMHFYWETARRMQGRPIFSSFDDRNEGVRRHGSRERCAVGNWYRRTYVGKRA